jgi:hypothetical protein
MSYGAAGDDSNDACQAVARDEREGTGHDRWGKRNVRYLRDLGFGGAATFLGLAAGAASVFFGFALVLVPPVEPLPVAVFFAAPVAAAAKVRR